MVTEDEDSRNYCFTYSLQLALLLVYLLRCFKVVHIAQCVYVTVITSKYCNTQEKYQRGCHFTTISECVT